MDSSNPRDEIECELDTAELPTRQNDGFDRIRGLLLALRRRVFNHTEQMDAYRRQRNWEEAHRN